MRQRACVQLACIIALFDSPHIERIRVAVWTTAEMLKPKVCMHSSAFSVSCVSPGGNHHGSYTPVCTPVIIMLACVQVRRNPAHYGAPATALQSPQALDHWLQEVIVMKTLGELQHHGLVGKKAAHAHQVAPTISLRPLALSCASSALLTS